MKRQTTRKHVARAHSTPLRISRLLQGALSRVGLEKDYYQWQIFNLWDRSVGKTIASHAQPSRINRGLLYVAVSHSTWMQELQFMKQELVDRLNREIQTLMEKSENQLPLNLTPIKDIRFFQGRLRHEAPLKTEDKQAQATPSLPPSPSLVNQAQKETQDIADPDLRALLERLWIKTQI